jgi:hypothetical protein
VPNWAEQVTAIATAVGAVGLLSTVGLAVAAGRQVREARHATQSQITADFVRRWGKPSIDAMRGDYPMFRALVAKMRTTLGAE